MDPSIYYCLFMMTCFGAQRKNVFLSSCPSNCECFHASSDGIGGSEAESFICNDLSFLRATSFNNKLINTFVLKNGFFQKEDYSRINKKYETISVVLENFQVDQNIQTNTQYIFNLFDNKTLKYLTILKSTFELLGSSVSSFDWTLFVAFSNLETIYIEDSYLPVLGESFSSVVLDKLHTLVIKSSLLQYIDFEALVGKWNLRKLIITDNELRNWNWLTSLRSPLNQLWHLDLNTNHLTYIPANLRTILPNLRVLYLAHNRLRYFSYNAMLPWFGIDEFQPANSKPANLANQPEYNYMYYTEEFEQILQSNNIESIFFEDALLYQIGYVCANGKSATNFIDFDFSCRQSNDMFNYFPDNLQVNSVGKLETLVGNGQYTLSEVVIEGFDFEDSPIDPKQPNEIFYFDSTTTPTKYRANRALLVNQLNSIKNELGNAIRLHLFSKVMLDYLLGKTKITNEHIQLVVDLVGDFLDEAANAQTYVMLIMWNYDNQLIQAIRDVPTYSLDNFEKTVLKPLFERISSHPALIGIEVINQFLTDEFNVNANRPDEPDAELCQASYMNSISLQMRFLAFNAQFVKLHSGGKLIGLSIDASCKFCLPLAMAKACRKKYGFETLNGFDFITLISNVNHVGQEPYGYLSWEINKPNYFDLADIEGTNGVPTSAKYRGVFYALRGTLNPTIIGSINSFASGYFVAK